MIDSMQAILQPTIPVTNIFSASSRYSGSETATIERSNGQIVIYLRRRFIPSPERFEVCRRFCPGPRVYE